MSSAGSASLSPQPVAPPTPQEISRKLSLHSKPQKPTIAHAPVSGTESDSDSVLSPDVSPPALAGGLLSMSPSSQKPLSSIAERRSGSGEGEESEEEEEEEDAEGGWRADGPVKQDRPHGDSVIKTGYLWKKGERRKTWKKRWFVLRPGHLAFYKSSAEYQLLRLLDLTEVHACTVVMLKRHAHSFGLVSPARTYYLQAENAAELQAWVAKINETRQALMTTSTQNSISIATPPIPIPGSSSHTHPPVTSSPPSHAHHNVTSDSDSEDHDTFPTSYSPNAAAISPSKGPTVAPKDPSKMIISGYLMKCRSKRRNWRKRWFVLTGEKLTYSASHMDTKRQRVIDLSQILDALEFDLPTSRHQGHLGPSTAAVPPLPSSVPKSTDDAEGTQANYTFKIVTTKRSLLLCAPSEDEEIKWLSAVRALIARRSGAASVPGAGASAAGGNAPKGLASVGPSALHSHSPTSHARKRSTSAASSGFAAGGDEHAH